MNWRRFLLTFRSDQPRIFAPLKSLMPDPSEATLLSSKPGGSYPPLGNLAQLRSFEKLGVPGMWLGADDDEEYSESRNPGSREHSSRESRLHGAKSPIDGADGSPKPPSPLCHHPRKERAFIRGRSICCVTHDFAFTRSMFVFN